MTEPYSKMFIFNDEQLKAFKDICLEIGLKPITFSKTNKYNNEGLNQQYSVLITSNELPKIKEYLTHENSELASSIFNQEL